MSEAVAVVKWSRREFAAGLMVPLGLGWACAGCGSGSTGSSAPSTSSAARSEGPLRIAAATDLQIVLPKLIEAFESTRDDVVTVPSFGASGNLAEQIRRGAPFDVFLSADMAFVRGLGDEGLIDPGSIEPYTRGSLVLVVHPAAAEVVDGLADLTRPEIVKVAIANPRFAPYGRAAREALRSAGLWDKLEPKIVLADSARQALVYERQGDAEAALVSRSLVDLDVDADSVGDKVIEVNPRLHSPLIQGLGIVARSPSRDQARAFVNFVSGNRGQLILEEAGFGPPKGGEVVDAEGR